MPGSAKIAGFALIAILALSAAQSPALRERVADRLASVRSDTRYGAYAQPSRDERASLARPRLARSTWPIYHADLRASASSPDRGPGPITTAESVAALRAPGTLIPKVSPWVLLASPYRDGSQAVIASPNDGVAKYLIRAGRLEPVDFLALDRRLFDFDWGILLLEGGLAVTTERKRNAITIIGDARPGDPRAPLAVKKRIVVNPRQHGAITPHLSLHPRGQLIVLTTTGRLLAIDLDQGSVVAVYDAAASAGYAYHNAFPIDDGGRIYLSGQSRMAAVDWDGERFSTAWIARYDMRGPGCEARDPDPRPLREALAVARGQTCTGSGTTPTLLGSRQNGVVVIVDGHAPRNNLVAFWRDDPPADWRPLRDPTGRTQLLDRRVAGVFALPYSTPEGLGFTAENSPATMDNGIIVAQWAGFAPSIRSPRGVQRVNWNPVTRSLALAWANPSIMFNGVPTIACRTRGRDCHTYGMGRYGNSYHYVSLDWETGRETGRIDLGTDDAVLDQGNGHAVAHDGSIVFSGKRRIVRVR